MESTLQQLQQNTYPGRGILARDSTGRPRRLRLFSHRAQRKQPQPPPAGGRCQPAHRIRRPQQGRRPVAGVLHPGAGAGRLPDRHKRRPDRDDFRSPPSWSFVPPSPYDTLRFEPDAPHYTPRISALLTRDGIDLSIVRRAGCDGSCLRRYWHLARVPGQGHLLHTYQQNGTPLPPFIGAPRPLAIPADPAALCRSLWDALPRDYRIALCVRYTDLATGQFVSCLENLHGASSWNNSN